MNYYYWDLAAEYADGTTFEKQVPYTGSGIYREDDDYQYDLECWLIGRRPDDLVWYSVVLVSRDDLLSF